MNLDTLLIKNKARLAKLIEENASKSKILHQSRKVDILVNKKMKEYIKENNKKI